MGKDWKMKRRTEDKRREILQGLLNGRYTPLTTDDQLRFCAGLQIESIRREMSKEDIQQIGAILGDNTQTVGSHVLAGAGPMYATVLIVHKDDWKLIATAYNEEIQRLKTVQV